MEKTSFGRSLVRERNIPHLRDAQSTFDSLSITEKAVFLGLALVLVGATLSLVGKASAEYSVSVPHKGGELIEGIVGTPRFINPLLAVSDADRDLTALVYSGLLKARPGGGFSLDLAESYNISPDGLEYSFTLKEDAVFHDGTPVTADDVVFTVTKAQDPALKSPRRVSWEGVTVEKTGVKSITFILKQPYAPFIANLTTGILPKHVWSGLETDPFIFSKKNTDAVGSGPYEISSVIRSNEDIPTEVVLRANPDYALGEPNISILHLKFYANENALAAALKNGEIESASNLSPASARELEDERAILRAPLTRVFGIFFNQNENDLLTSKDIRRALSMAIDRDDIIESVLLGYGTAADGPLPPTVAQAALKIREIGTTTGDLAAAGTLLEKAKWKKSPEGIYELKTSAGSTTLSLSLSTANIPELVESARRIEENWTALGAQVDVRVFEPTDLNQGVIRPRKYDALLFGIVTGKNADLYPFWHSSQRNDPGLNISLYTNVKADKALERMRTATSTEGAAAEYMKLKAEIDADVPAIFLWSPDFIYAAPKKLHGIVFDEITTPSDRFIGVEDWYVETDQVWKIFVGDKDQIIN
jgi:peptide/nickel transport system substrate-binding protein